jgi:thiol-disulfide isomerase/thioredoxin
MRKVLLIFVLMLVTGILGWLISQSLSSLTERQAREQSISELPVLNITPLDSDTRLLTDIPENTKTVLIMFNSECEYCQYEARTISSHFDQILDDTQLVFLSAEPLATIEQFRDNYFLSSNQNVTFAQVYLPQLIDTFKKISYPSIFVYNESGVLLKEFKGETKVEAILSALNSNY